MADLLAGKVAIITGGTSGIGLASVERFVAEGAQVVVGDIQDDLGKQLSERLGDSVTFLHADVTREEEIAALVTVLASAGGGAAGEPGPQELNPWGHPVDKLRYNVSSWQRVTLLERTHMRR